MKIGTRVTVLPTNSLFMNITGKSGIVVDYNQYADMIQVEFEDLPQLLWLQLIEVEVEE